MTEQSDDDDLWLGTCTHCGARYQVYNAAILAAHPEHAAAMNGTDEITVDCTAYEPAAGQPHHTVVLARQSVKIVPFSAWTVLPAATGCPVCGTEHDEHLPHDHSSLQYHYRFRSNEAKAGRPERWPTWHDAMAHCTDDMKQQWIAALRRQGVEI